MKEAAIAIAVAALWILLGELVHKKWKGVVGLRAYIATLVNIVGSAVCLQKGFSVPIFCSLSVFFYIPALWYELGKQKDTYKWRLWITEMGAISVIISIA